MSSDFDMESLLQQNKISVGTQAASGIKRKAELEPEVEQTDTKAALGKPKRRRVRTTYSNEQLRRLHGYFTMSPYPDLLMRQQMAEVIGVPEQKIQVWFQNRRAKMRKYENSRTVQLPAPLNIPVTSTWTSSAHFPGIPSSSTPVTTPNWTSPAHFPYIPSSSTPMTTPNWTSPAHFPCIPSSSTPMTTPTWTSPAHFPGIPRASSPLTISTRSSSAHLTGDQRTSSTPLTTSAHSHAANDRLPSYFPLRDPGPHHSILRMNSPSPPLPENVPPHCFPTFSYCENYVYLPTARSQHARALREASPSTHAVPRTPSPVCVLTPPLNGRPFYTDVLPQKYPVLDQQPPVPYKRM